MISPQSPAPGIPELSRRFKPLVIFVSVFFMLLIARLWQLQVIRGGEKRDQALRNVVKKRTMASVRGLIKDKSGLTLADNRAAHSVRVIPHKMDRSIFERLMELLELPSDRVEPLWKKIQHGKAKDPLEPVQVLEDMTRDQLAALEQHEAELKGVEITGVLHRRYPHGTLASHVLGFMNEISQGELSVLGVRDKDRYRMGDVIGRSGIEKQMESYLRGESGEEQIVVDARGRRLTDRKSLEMIEGDAFTAPVPGHNVILTLDADLQRQAERAMRNWPSGAVAVIEVSTGRILALLSKPAIDPNELSGSLTRTAEQLLVGDPFRPLIDKSLRENYYPGSTYKVVAAVAGLEEGLVTGSEKILCGGEYALGSTHFRCGGSHGPTDLVTALTQSCNVYFYKLSERVGMDRLAKYARDLGFGAPTGLGLNGEVAGFIPTKEFYEKSSKEGFRIGFTLNTGIGQGSTKVTVLQMALAYATIANGGSLHLPQIVERIETASGQIVQEFPPRLRRRIQVKPESLALVVRGLTGVVNDPRGTAYTHRILETEVAGKTGTAQVKKLAKQSTLKWEAGKDHAWFASFAPASAPEIAVVVLVEHGGKGGAVAAPVAMEIYKSYFEGRGVSQDPMIVASPAALDGSGDDDDDDGDYYDGNEPVPTAPAPSGP